MPPLEPILAAALAFAVTAAGLLLLEWTVRKLRHSANKSYRWGVWVFAALAAIWIFITSLGR
jgi:hypothetical protein